MARSVAALAFAVLCLASRAAASTPEGVAWLEANAKKDGVVTLPSGLQYKIIEAGSGAKPLASTPCSCHYEGSLMDGTVFDSSFKRGTPSTFAPNQVIKVRLAAAR